MCLMLPVVKFALSALPARQPSSHLHMTGMAGVASVFSHCTALQPLLLTGIHVLQKGMRWVRAKRMSTTGVGGHRRLKASRKVPGLWFSGLMMAVCHHCLQMPSGSAKSQDFGWTVPCAGASSAPQKLREPEAALWAHELFEPQTPRCVMELVIPFWHSFMEKCVSQMPASQ